MPKKLTFRDLYKIQVCQNNISGCCQYTEKLHSLNLDKQKL